MKLEELKQKVTSWNKCLAISTVIYTIFQTSICLYFFMHSKFKKTPWWEYAFLLSFYPVIIKNVVISMQIIYTMKEFNIYELPELKKRYKDLVLLRQQTFILTDVVFVISGTFLIISLISWSKCKFMTACTIPYAMTFLSGSVTVLNLLLVIIQIVAQRIDTKYCRLLDTIKKPAQQKLLA